MNRDSNNIPVVHVKASKRRGWRVWRLTCPFCGESHVHGWPALGLRLSHCADPALRGQYDLRVVT